MSDLCPSCMMPKDNYGVLCPDPFHSGFVPEVQTRQKKFIAKKFVAEKFLSKEIGKTLEEINDSEPFYLHQGEVITILEHYADGLQDELEQLKVDKELYRQSIGRSGEDYLLEIDRKNRHIEVLKTENKELRNRLSDANHKLMSQDINPS